MKDIKHWLPGTIISLIAIAAILYFVDLNRLVEAIRNANYWLLLLSVVMGIIWLLIRTAVWRTILQEKASLKDTFLVLCEGYFLNAILPFRLGEIGRAFLLGRRAKLNFMEVLPTIVLERAFDLAFSAVLLLIALPFVVNSSGAESISIIVGVLVVIGMLTLYILARNRDWAIRQLHRLPWLEKVGGHFLPPFFDGLAILTDGWRFLRTLGLMALNWAWAVIQFYFIIIAFFPAAQMSWAVFGLGAAAFGGAVPSAPGAVGTYEAALGGALTLVTSDEARSVAVAVTAHLLNYIITLVLGIYALSTEGQTLSGIYHQLRRQQEAESQEETNAT
ncbi:MAG: flippase-like domain-containing protein [Chloroflexi bacterium]|nr:flippase-like domain-containing protein [Chloroflexota bacterium]